MSPKTSLILVAAAALLLLAGVGGWVASTTHESTVKPYPLHHGGTARVSGSLSALPFCPADKFYLCDNLTFEE